MLGLAAMPANATIVFELVREQGRLQVLTAVDVLFVAVLPFFCGGGSDYDGYTNNGAIFFCCGGGGNVVVETVVDSLWWGR